MSRDKEGRLESLGFDVKIIVGWDENHTKGHCWIKIGYISLDSIFGIPLFNSYRYPYDLEEFDDYKNYLESRE